MVSLGAIGRYGESFSSSGNDISADGSVIVGSSTAPTGFVAFRWTQAGGMVALASLPGETRSVANAVSADGTVTVGTSSAGFTDSAVRWTSAGAQSIADWLAAAGADIDQRIGRNGVLSLSAHKTVGNAGGNPFSVSASLHFGF